MPFLEKNWPIVLVMVLLGVLLLPAAVGVIRAYEGRNGKKE